jgi:hypothetical protein
VAIGEVQQVDVAEARHVVELLRGARSLCVAARESHAAGAGHRQHLQELASIHTDFRPSRARSAFAIARQGGDVVVEHLAHFLLHHAALPSSTYSSGSPLRLPKAWRKASESIVAGKV